MRKLIFVIASMFVFGTASAEHTGNPGGNGYGNTYDYSHTSNKTVSAKARSNSDAYSGSSTDGSGNASTYIDQSNSSRNVTEASAIIPGAYAAPPSASCLLTFGASGGIVGVAASISGGKFDGECRKLEAYRLAMLRPDRPLNCMGRYIFMDTKAAKAVADRNYTRMMAMINQDCGGSTVPPVKFTPVTMITPLPLAETCDTGSYLAKVNGRVQCHNPAFRGERG